MLIIPKPYHVNIEQKNLCFSPSLKSGLVTGTVDWVRLTWSFFSHFNMVNRRGEKNLQLAKCLYFVTMVSGRKPYWFLRFLQKLVFSIHRGIEYRFWEEVKSLGIYMIKIQKMFLLHREKQCALTAQGGRGPCACTYVGNANKI